MAAASGATGMRTWLQTHQIEWLTPRRMRGITIGVMCAAGLVCTVGVGGATPPPATHGAVRAAHVIPAR